MRGCGQRRACHSWRIHPLRCSYSRPQVRQQVVVRVVHRCESGSESALHSMVIEQLMAFERQTSLLYVSVTSNPKAAAYKLWYISAEVFVTTEMPLTELRDSRE